MIPCCPSCGSQETQYVGLQLVCLSCGHRDQIHDDNPASPWPAADAPKKGKKA